MQSNEWNDKRKSNPWLPRSTRKPMITRCGGKYIHATNRRPIYKFPFNLDLHTRSTFVRLHHKESWRRTEKIANKFSHAPLPRVTWPVAVVINSVVVLAFTNRRSIREENESVAVIRATERVERANSFRPFEYVSIKTRRALTFAKRVIEICPIDRLERWIWVNFRANFESGYIYTIYRISWELFFLRGPLWIFVLYCIIFVLQMCISKYINI